MPADEYFYIDPNNETVGPISWEVLQQLARAGVVADESLTAPEGASDWIPFAELKAKEEAKSKLPPVPGGKAEVRTGEKSDRNRERPSSALDPSHGIEETRTAEIAATVGVEPIWGAVFCWIGIYLLRLLIGLVVGWIVVRILEGEDNSQAWFFGVALLALALMLASVTFLPLWRGLEKTNFRGRAGAVAATRNFLFPAIAFQLFVTMVGGLGLGVANFLVVVGVCYLVTLAQDFDRRSQFVLLLIGGAQAIVLCLVSMLLDPMTTNDGWQIKIGVWLGAVPPIVLMVILYRQSRHVLPGSSLERHVPANEGGSQ